MKCPISLKVHDMKYVSGSRDVLTNIDEEAVPIVLFDRVSSKYISVGTSIIKDLFRKRLKPDPVAWDLLAIALSVIAADGATRRKNSSDGWTRQFELKITLYDSEAWSSCMDLLSSALAFLTTDQWQIEFCGGGELCIPLMQEQLFYPKADAVILLSGGLDSLIGAIDFVEKGKKLFPVSQIVRGDAEKQRRFTEIIGTGTEHLQLNHGLSISRSSKEVTQRSRSFLFIAYAVLAATSTERYQHGERVPIYICENGFIAINPPLTNARIGSLSTRTTNPEFLGRMQDIFDAVGLRLTIINPYLERTKGEMLQECLNQEILYSQAFKSTSCGRFQRFKYQHCGRCLPCQIRRAAFIKWGCSDATEYVYENLGIPDKDHARFDDVRSVALARLVSEEKGLEYWLGPALSSPRINNRSAVRKMLLRGLDELGELHSKYGVA